MRKLRFISIFFCFLWFASCGGEGGTDDEDLVLTDTDITNIAISLENAFKAANSQSPSPSSAPFIVNETSVRIATNTPVRGTVACPVAGHIRVSGNINAACPDPPATGNCTVSGLVTFTYSNPTNNLDDCDFGNFIVTGSLTVGITGSFDSQTGANLRVTETVSGILNLNRRGPLGGWFRRGVARLVSPPGYPNARLRDLSAGRVSTELFNQKPGSESNGASYSCTCPWGRRPWDGAGLGVEPRRACFPA